MNMSMQEQLTSRRRRCRASPGPNHMALQAQGRSGAWLKVSALLLLAIALQSCVTPASAVVVPNSPRQPRAQTGSISDVAVTIEWDAPLSQGPDIESYEVAYRQLGRTQWVVDSETVQGTPGLKHREIQEVTTRADPGQVIDGGYFRLSLNFEGYNDYLPEKPSRTPPLAFNATADEVKAELQALGNIGIVEVRRAGPTSQGGYTWRVTFDWERFVRRGNLPMLVASQIALPVTWSGGGDSVVISEYRRGTTGPTACIVGVCEARVGGLQPFTSYQFRVKARNSVGWSSNGGSSRLIRTLQSAPPITPSPPTVSAVTSDSITCKLPAIPPAPEGTPAVTMVEVQYHLSSSTTGAWTSVPGVSPSASVVTVRGLAASTDYVFRARMQNSEGPGPWSPPSGVMTTDPAAPPAPIVLAPELENVFHSSVVLQWKPDPATPVNAPILTYQVQARINQEDWMLVATDISGIERNSIREVQSVSTRSDPGTVVDSGSFTISINFQGSSDFDPSSGGKTGLIPYNAPASVVQQELSVLLPLASGVEVRRVGPNAEGGYTWLITLDWDLGVLKSGVDVRANLPRLIADPVALGGRWSQAGNGVVATTVRTGAPAVVRELVTETIPGLKSSSLYQFRVRGTNAHGTSEWSPPAPRVRTMAPPPLTALQLSLQDAVFPNVTLPPAQLPGGTRLLGGNRHQIALPAAQDPDYQLGVGVGGGPLQPGGVGLVVITSYLYNQGQVDKITFEYQDPAVYQGRPQIYVVPKSPVKGATLDFLDIKLWGGGGGGGAGHANYTSGGAGAFVQGRLAVKTGDVLLILVGGGGGASAGDRGGAGGFNGGGDGGGGERGGGGGGGASTVTKANIAYPLFTAAGGGGGGSTDYCCAYGGAGSEATGTLLGAGGLGATPVDTPRDNAGDTKRVRTEFNDDRDLTGLAAEHEHLDYGFAPAADYSRIASGGTGAALTAGGSAGESGSYVFRPSSDLQRRSFSFNPQFGTDATAVSSLTGAVAQNATAGSRLQGGRGASGKEGGGGGGGGWFGGGGGGAGVDGGGGGGGSSYLHPQAMYEPPFEPEIPPAPRVARVTATSVLLEWDGVRVGSNGQLATAYTLEQSIGVSNDEYVEIFTGTGDARRRVATNLRPVALYRFRLIATDPLTGPGLPGEAVSVMTTSIPTNVWTRPSSRSVGEGRAGAGRRAVDAPTAEVSMLPSPMQGTTLSPLLGYGFLFGGRSAGEDCDQAVLAFCRHNVGVRNDLWRVDPVTNAWLLLDTGSVKPPARERHVAGVIDNKLLIFGGSTDPVGVGGAGFFLNDLWLLDPDRAERTVTVSSQHIKNTTTGDLIPEGKFLRTAMDVTISEEECTTHIEVWVKMEHSCLHNVRVSVNGPLIAPYREPNADWPFGERLPLGMALGEQTVLFRGGTGKGTANRNVPCRDTDGSPVAEDDDAETIIRFADDAATGIEDCCEGTVTGSYRPVDMLRRYENLPPTGEWVLNIYDADVDGLRGRLLDWGITVKLVPCNRKYTWTELGGSTAAVRPGPRHDATAVVVDHSWFIWGGTTNRMLHDLWRYDLDTDTWTELTLARPLAQPSALGRQGVLSPWGVLVWGGRGVGSHHLAPQNTYRWDVVDAKYVAVRPPPASDPRLHEAGEFLDPNYNLNDNHLENDWSFSAAVALETDVPEFPPRRMLHSMALFGVLGTNSRTRGVNLPKLFVFGGFNGNTALDDIWELSLNNPDEGFEYNSQDFQGAEIPPGGFFIQQRYDEHCEWHHIEDTTGDSYHVGCSTESTAGQPDSTAICDPQHILIRAWCDRNYQSIGRF